MMWGIKRATLRFHVVLLVAVTSLYVLRDRGSAMAWSLKRDAPRDGDGAVAFVLSATCMNLCSIWLPFNAALAVRVRLVCIYWLSPSVHMFGPSASRVFHVWHSFRLMMRYLQSEISGISDSMYPSRMLGFLKTPSLNSRNIGSHCFSRSSLQNWPCKNSRPSVCGVGQFCCCTVENMNLQKTQNSWCIFHGLFRT